MDRRCWHPPQPQHRGRLVRRRQNRQRSPVFSFAPFVIARDHLDTRRLQATVKFGQKHGLARPGLANDGKNGVPPLGHRRQRAFDQIDARTDKGGCQPVIGIRLVMREGQHGGLHGVTLARPKAKR